MPRWLPALALLLSAAALVGCTATARAGATAPEDAFPPTGPVEDLGLPFDAYSPSLGVMYAILNAEDRLTRECMTAAGQEWKVVVRPTTIKDLRNRRRYGVVELPIAQKYGYHVPTGLLTSANVEALYDARDNSLSQSQKDAVYGEQGCAAQAARRLQPGGEADDGRLSQLDRQSLNESQRDPAVAAALTKWRECVQQQGFAYRDPFAAISDERWWADDSAGPSPDELAVAVADVRCKEQTGLIDAWHAAETRIQQELIGENADYFAKLSAALEKELAAAKAVR